MDILFLLFVLLVGVIAYLLTSSILVAILAAVVAAVFVVLIGRPAYAGRNRVP